MKTVHHPLAHAALGTQRSIVSVHFGEVDAAPSVYIQAGLHADEPPGMLVAHHLRRKLVALEAAGRLRGSVTLVPVANPIGLAQTVWRKNHGRFDAATGENFNRHYPALAPLVAPLVEGRLGADAAANVAVVRSAMQQALADVPVRTELESQRRILLGLACGADTVLDLHCDCEAVTHLYTATPLWPQAEALARCMGAEVSLLALDSGDDPFDEACSQTWWRLAERLARDQPAQLSDQLATDQPAQPSDHLAHRPVLPLACLSATVELRGETDVDHSLAEADADALIVFLAHRGVVDAPAAELPPLRHPATPLEGCQIAITPVSGVVVYHRAPGEVVARGDAIADIVDPLTGTVHTLHADTDGVLFAREIQRYATAGRSLFKIAGASPIRRGKLSTAR